MCCPPERRDVLAFLLSNPRRRLLSRLLFSEYARLTSSRGQELHLRFAFAFVPRLGALNLTHFKIVVDSILGTLLRANCISSQQLQGVEKLKG